MKFVARFIPLALAASCAAAGPMPAARQNALIDKYCAVCHTDAARNGGLSLEHFDVAHTDPTLAAMLLSKLTGGVALKTVKAVPTDPAAAALLDRRMKGGAMGAAGIPIPDMATVHSLIDSLAAESDGAGNWNVLRNGSTTAAAILTELPQDEPGTARFYRFTVSCDATTHQGAMQLAWSPVAKNGTLTVTVDSGAPLHLAIKGSEIMGNASGVVTNGLAVIPLDLNWPANSLSFTDLFPGENVSLSFTALPAAARHELRACFSTPVI
jgi:hypothetical protein